MISTRRFHRMIDEYVTGLHDPYAPFNVDMPPICEFCEVEDCTRPCEKLEREIEKMEKMRREEDYWLYVEFLKDLSFDDAITLDDSILLDWLGLSERRLPEE